MTSHYTSLYRVAQTWVSQLLILEWFASFSCDVEKPGAQGHDNAMAHHLFGRYMAGTSFQTCQSKSAFLSCPRLHIQELVYGYENMDKTFSQIEPRPFLQQWEIMWVSTGYRLDRQMIFHPWQWTCTMSVSITYNVVMIAYGIRLYNNNISVRLYYVDILHTSVSISVATFMHTFCWASIPDTTDSSSIVTFEGLFWRWDSHLLFEWSIREHIAFWSFRGFPQGSLRLSVLRHLKLLNLVASSWQPFDPQTILVAVAWRPDETSACRMM